VNINRREFLKLTGISSILGIGGVLFVDKLSSEPVRRDVLQFEYKEGEKKIRHDYIFGVEIYQQPDFPKPDKGASYFDPVFGTKITRISDQTVDGLRSVSNKIGSIMHPAYPKHNYDNADGTYLLFHGSYRSGQVIYDSKTLKLLKSLSTKAVSFAQPVEPRWDAHNPHLLYFHRRPPTAFSVYDVRTDKFEILHDFSKEFPGAKIITMAEEGDCSYDSRYFAFAIVGERGGRKWAGLAVVCYDRVKDRIVGKIDLPIRGFENQGAGNWVGMSPSGRFVLLGTAPMLVYDREFKGRPVKLPHGGGWHCDVSLDDEGREVIFYMGGLTFSPGGQSNGCYAMCDLETGTETVLTEKVGGPSGMGAHLDCSCIFTPGWGLVSTYHKAPLKQSHWAEYSIYLVELTRRKNPPPRIWRICHTHVNREGYIDDPFATFDRFGKKIFFGSNWGKPVTQGGDIDVYQVELPPNWYDDLMGKEKAIKLRMIAEEMVKKKW
jgi:hypothetical protein